MCIYIHAAYNNAHMILKGVCEARKYSDDDENEMFDVNMKEREEGGGNTVGMQVKKKYGFVIND